MSKFCIYSFNDRKGVLDDAALLFLKDLSSHFDKIVISVIGELDTSSADQIKEYSEQIVSVEGSTSFGEGYKQGLSSLGWENIQSCDSITFCNSTLFGPFYDTSVLYSKMDQAECDYWGLVKQYEAESEPYPFVRYGGVPEHVSSSFLTLKNSVLAKESFRKFVETLPFLKSDEETLGGFTLKLNQYLESEGFISACYVDEHIYRGVTENPFVFKPCELVREYKVPYLEKTAFTCDLSSRLEKTTNLEPSRLMNLLKKEELYPIDRLWKNLLRNHNLYHLKSNLNLNYILSDSGNAYQGSSTPRIALLLHIYYIDLFPFCMNYLKNLPDDCDIFITTDTEEKKEELRSLSDSRDLAVKDIFLVQNRGRDVSAFLVGGKCIIRNYDLVCFIHDKKSSQHDYEIIGQDFFYRCLNCLLNTSGYVGNLIELFHKNPSLGVLMPPLPGFAYFKLYGDAWDRNFDDAKGLFEQLGLDVPLSHDLPPIGPFGSMFWFRPDAISQILDYEWTYDDFPAEPLAIDGTISHAIERIYPYVAQQNGYYSAYVTTQEYAEVDLGNSNYVMNSINQILFDKYLVSDYSLLIKTLKGVKSKKLYSYTHFREQLLKARKVLKKRLPRPLFVTLMKLKRLIIGPRDLKGYF